MKLNDCLTNRTLILGKIVFAELEREFFKVEFQNPYNPDDKKPLYGILPFSEYSMQGFLKLTTNSPEDSSKKVLGKDAIFAVGKTISCIITEISDNIYLSRKATQAEKFEQLQVGNIVKCTITHINKNLTFVELSTGILAFIPITELSTSRYTDVKNWLKEGDTIVGIISKKDPDGKITISRKKFYTDYYNDPVAVEQVRPCKISTPIQNGYFVEIHPGLSGIMDTPLNCDIHFTEGQTVYCLIHKIRKRPDGVTAYNLRYVGS